MGEKRKRQGWPPDVAYDPAGMSLEKALTMIDASKQKARLMGFPVTLAVHDVGGNPVAVQRMDDAPFLSLEVAMNKAKTAVFGKIPTDQWGPAFKDADSPLSTLWFHSGWITFPGGFPVVMGGRIIGGLGCSGATWEDSAIARAGLLALGADLSGAEEYLDRTGIPRENW